MDDKNTEISFYAELSRKALHLVVLTVPYGIWHLGAAWSLRILIPLTFLAIAGDVMRWYSIDFSNTIERYFGWMMRSTERPDRAGPVMNGATSILVAALISVIIFPARVSAAGLAIFVVADAAAAIVGRRFGRKRLWGGKATLAGTSAFVIAGCLTGSIFPGIPMTLLVPIVLLASVLEATPLPVNDNIVVPLVISGALELFLISM